MVNIGLRSAGFGLPRRTLNPSSSIRHALALRRPTRFLRRPLHVLNFEVYHYLWAAVGRVTRVTLVSFSSAVCSSERWVTDSLSLGRLLSSFACLVELNFAMDKSIMEVDTVTGQSFYCMQCCTPHYRGNRWFFARHLGIRRCLPLYDHTCRWICAPTYLCNTKFHIILVGIQATGTIRR
jgi:hypothetical protein